MLKKLLPLILGTYGSVVRGSVNVTTSTKGVMHKAPQLCTQHLLSPPQSASVRHSRVHS